ncbi:EF-hand calcium-binding domain-containing protein 5-like isoform X7 [Lytechinus variegatus]|uniref:EF-hand calcium-binding domain-containing protein 5-like isoform X7 n=1 Tax=Lytechinus variegatus TaxID=7654 RepID=UPI001BB0FBE5|nr:EF-hand calcium-binding domain-containing protein 5-like isoform X7 [Lytechinus variegatus]
MAEVQAVSPAGSRSFIEPRPPSQSGSRSSSRVGFTEGAHSRHSSGRIKYVPSHRPTSNARSTPSSSERPPSVRSLREKKDLNEYLSPIVKTAVRRWKRFHEQKVIERFKERRESKKQRVKDIKEEKKRLARRIPIDTLAVEWLNKNELTVDARAYLLDKLLPTLILGIEKLLMEAERRDLTEKNEANPNFNPLNYLAQYLMRNNPRYSNFPEASPYIRGMQEVTDELKQFVFSFEDNRLARVKAETRRKREHIERTEALKTQEKSRRSAHIRRHYKDWLLDPEGLVEQRAIQNSLTSFKEVLENLPEEFKKASSFLTELEKLDASEEQFNEEDFAQYLKNYVLKLAPELYDALMGHMAQCALAYRHAAVLEARRDILMSLFSDIDHADVGILNRHRVLGLFENFWENVPWSLKRHLRNPRKWPVIELTETDDTESLISEGSSISSVKSSMKESEPTAPSEGTVQEETTGEVGAAPVVDGGEAPEEGIKDEESEQAEKTAEPVKSEDPAAPVAETAEGTAETAEPQSKEQEPTSTDEGATAAEVTAPEVTPGETMSGDAVPAEIAGGEKEKTEEGTRDQAAPGAEETQAGEDKLDELTSAKDRATLQPTTANTLTGRSTSVSFHEDAIKLKEEKADSEDRPKTPVKTPTVRSGSRSGSAFDESALNSSQFVQLVELFLGEDSPQYVVDALVKFITDGYVETEQEKFLRLQQARREAQSAKRRQMVDQLFDKWDNDGSGYLDLEEFHSIMAKFKDNMESRIMAKAKQKLEKEELDNRLSKPEFKAYIEAVCSLLPGGPDNFDPLIDFLMTSVERSYEERIRGQARKKWLASIIQAAETSAGSMQPVYKSVFNSLYKDADQHGRGKRISANIGLLERNDITPGRGLTCLRYVAATPDDAGFMLNKILFRDMKGISFSSIDSGKPIHVPRVQNHGNIMFWNPERADEKWDDEDFQPSFLEEKYKKISIDDYDPARDRQGSFLVIPLKDFRKRVFGLMGIDTLNDPHDKSIFITHEISFFQGVAKAFATAYQYVDVRRKTLRIAESAVSWIHRRSPHVQEINVFMVEPDDKIDDFVLRRMITTDKKGTITVHDRPPRLERKENLFRDYLFKTVDNSETVTADAYGQRHLAFPLRDTDGRCVALVDLSIGELKQLPGHENKEVQRMLKLLQAAHKEVSQESAGGDRKIVLEAEKGSDESRIDIMFDRIMLTDLRNTVSKLNAQAFAELKSYKDPPKVIHSILVSVLALFYRDKYEEGELDAWNTCKQFVNPELIKKIEEFDPTAEHIPGIVGMISGHLKDVPHGAVAKHGSLPAQNLYNWAFVCLSLLEHTSKMTRHKPPGVAPPPGTAASGEVRTVEQ